MIWHSVHVEGAEQCTVICTLARRVDCGHPWPVLTLAANALSTEPAYEDEGFAFLQHQRRRSVGDNLVLEAGHQVGARIGMLMPCRHNGAGLKALLVDFPSRRVTFSTHLHLFHVLVPGANAPDVVVIGKGLLNVGFVAGAVRSHTGKDNCKAFVGTCRVDPEITRADGIRVQAESV